LVPYYRLNGSYHSVNPNKAKQLATEITYWRDRVSSLEALVGELLAKNQAMRSILESATPKRRSAGASDATESISENGDSGS
jgi:hypothetical protein